MIFYEFDKSDEYGDYAEYKFPDGPKELFNADIYLECFLEGSLYRDKTKIYSDY